MTIPVRNIYFLLSYAWDRLKEADIVAVSATSETTLPDLLARVLVGGTGHLLKRGVDRGYCTQRGDVDGIRGRIDFPVSIRRSLLNRGRAHCSYDELSHNVLHNQILRATLRLAANTEGIDRALRTALRGLYHRLDGVEPRQVRAKDFRLVQLHRNNSFYGFLMDVCLLMHRNVLVDEPSGQLRFRGFSRDEMADLFQRFVYRFFENEQERYSVWSERLPWQAQGLPEDLAFLPSMQTDVVLSSRDRRLIIETKFYEQPLAVRYGHKAVRSDHLYQLYAYLENMKPVHSDQSVEGLLLYAGVEEPISLDYHLHGYPVRVRSIDLSRDSASIATDMLSLIN